MKHCPETKTIYTEDALALSSVCVTGDFLFSIAKIFVDRSAHREIARIASIFKNAAKDDRSNYGPISILPFATRLFYKLLFNRFCVYLYANQW